MKKVLLLMAFCLIGMASSFAQDFTVDGIGYRECINGMPGYVDGENCVQIYLTMNATGDVVIPATVTYDGKEYKVTAIAQNAFNSDAGLTSVSFAELSYCTVVQQRAFYNCANLQKITFPNSLTTIANSNSAVISSCPKLTEIVLPENNPDFTTIPDKAFQNVTSLTSLTIPASVTTIGYNNFQNNANLETLTFAGPGDPEKPLVINGENFTNSKNIKTIYAQRNPAPTCDTYGTPTPIFPSDLTDVTVWTAPGVEGYDNDEWKAVSDAQGPQTGVENVEVSPDGTVEIFNICGVRVYSGSLAGARNLKGLHIVRTADKAVKMIF